MSPQGSQTARVRMIAADRFTQRAIPAAVASELTAGLHTAHGLENASRFGGGWSWKPVRTEGFVPRLQLVRQYLVGEGPARCLALTRRHGIHALLGNETASTRGQREWGLRSRLESRPRAVQEPSKSRPRAARCPGLAGHADHMKLRDECRRLRRGIAPWNTRARTGPFVALKDGASPLPKASPRSAMLPGSASFHGRALLGASARYAQQPMRWQSSEFGRGSMSAHPPEWILATDSRTHGTATADSEARGKDCSVWCGRG